MQVNNNWSQFTSDLTDEYAFQADLKSQSASLTAQINQMNAQFQQTGDRGALQTAANTANTSFTAYVNALASKYPSISGNSEFGVLVGNLSTAWNTAYLSCLPTIPNPNGGAPLHVTYNSDGSVTVIVTSSYSPGGYHVDPVMNCKNEGDSSFWWIPDNSDTDPSSYSFAEKLTEMEDNGSAWFNWQNETPGGEGITLTKEPNNMVQLSITVQASNSNFLNEITVNPDATALTNFSENIFGSNS